MRICDDLTDEHSYVFTRKSVVDKTPIRDSSIWCKTAEIDVSQLGPYSVCQAMHTGLYTIWELDCDFGPGKPRQNKARIWGTWPSHTSSESDHSKRRKSFTRQAHRRKKTLLALTASVDTATLSLKLWHASFF